MKNGLVWGATLFLVAAASTSSVEGQTARLTVEDARAELMTIGRDGGYWAASNARYLTPEANEPSEYRMSFSLFPSGYSATGCLWDDKDGEEATVFWHFFSGWDPTRGTIIAYQVSPGGVVAVGEQRAGREGTTESIQTLHVPGSEETQIRHLNRTVDRNTLESRSFDHEEGRWVPRREYTWVWRPTDVATPCAT